MTLRRNLGFTAYPRNPAFGTGKKMKTVNCSLTFPTTGAAGDQYILGGPFTLDQRISRLNVQAFPALTTATDSNLGFYYLKPDGTLAVVKASGGNELWSAVSLATAITVYQDMLQSKNSSLDRTKSIGQLLSLGSDKEPVGGVYLVLTLPTANTAGGTGHIDVITEESNAS